MKTISNLAGYIACGHALLKCDGLTEISATDRRGKQIERIVSRKMMPEDLDRVVSPFEFVSITGLSVSIAGQKIKLDKVEKPAISICDLISK